jgi:retron-type reverse transcriptase
MRAPIVKLFSDSSIYGLRSLRTAHNALGQLKQSLEQQTHQFQELVFFADIFSFFDKANYVLLLNNIF